MRKIKFVYYMGHVCRVWNQRDDGSVYIECTAATPSYMFTLQKGEYQIASYWDWSN